MRELWGALALRTRILAAAGAVMAVVLIVAAVTTPDPTPSEPARHLGLATHSPSPVAEPQATGARNVTTGYLGAFFDSTLAERDWRALIDARSTAYLAAANTRVPRGRIPKARLLHLRLDGTSKGYTEWTATMSGGLTLHVATLYTDGAWRVNEVAPVR